MHKLIEILETTKIPKRIEKFQINLYEDSDYNELMDLYQKVFPGYMSRDLWEWKNIKNPFGNFITVIIKDKGELIASYTVAPKLFYINGRKHMCVQSMDTMTEENYRGLGISTFLGKLTYDYVRKNNYDFVYGFPNNVSRYLFEVKLKWNKLIMCQYYSKKVKDIKKVNKKEKSNYYSIKEISKFDQEIDLLWKKSKDNYPIIIMKNKKYLNWRFSEHPLVNYRKYYLRHEKSSEIFAYFILKRYKKNNDEVLGHIVDFHIGINNIKLKREIFQTIEKYAVNQFKKDCDEISFWLPFEALKIIAKQKLKYKLKEDLPFFGYKILNEFKESKFISSLKNWVITMANNDVF